MHPSRCLTLHWLCPQLYISPPQLCHTLDSTVGTLGLTGGSCRAALGSINFIAYFYNPSLCMHPPSHPTTSALTGHTAVKFCVSPMFYGWLFPQTLLISSFAPWCPFKHLRVFIRLFFFFIFFASSWPIMNFIFLTLLNSDLRCFLKEVWGRSQCCCSCWKTSPPEPVGPPHVTAKPTGPLRKTECNKV